MLESSDIIITFTFNKKFNMYIFPDSYFSADQLNFEENVIKTVSTVAQANFLFMIIMYQNMSFLIFFH